MNLYTIPLTYLSGASFVQPAGVINDFSNEPRPLHSVAYIVSGKAVFVCENEQIEVVAGDVIYVAKGCRYYSLWNGTPETNFLSCHFDLIPFGEPIGTRFYPLQRIAHCESLYGDFLKIAEGDKKPMEALEAIGCFFHILATLFPRMKSTQRPSINETILQAIRHLEAHDSTPLHIPELARLCHLSTSYFYKCFKQETGMTPVEYKNKITVSRAQRILLDDPTAPIEEISARLGFESSIYFRRLFKAQTGKTPREYRQTATRKV